MNQLFKNLHDVKFAHLLSLLVTLFAFTYFILHSLVMSKVQQEGSREITIAVIGLLPFVLNYWLGSSNSSAKKDATIAAMAPAPSPINVETAQNVNAAPGDKQNSGITENPANTTDGKENSANQP